jgi:cell division transport system permease protein
MTETVGISRAAGGGMAVARTPRRQAPIVPPRNLAGNALILVIAIMTFLSCLTLGAVTLVRDTAATWQSQLAREATIQIKPADELDMAAALERARAIASSHSGVRSAAIVGEAATARLLEPWVGSGLDIAELPVPRLVIVTIDPASPPDFAAMRAALAAEIPQASLDDHRNWVDRLVAMARTTVLAGGAALALMLAATVLSVIFATRGAMTGNGHIIEVLHFVGAEARFIAGEFRHHFLLMGMKGAVAGGAGAILVFLVFSWWAHARLATPEADQASALFGNFAIGASGYAGVAVIVVVVGVLTAATSHVTVVSYLREIDTRQQDW